MARQKSAETETRWREIVERQAAGGESVRSFCAREGISQPSFYSWRKRLREMQDEGGRTPPAAQRAEAAEDAGLFIPLKLSGPAATLEIVHPLGYRIQVNGEVNPLTLRRVIEALDERGTR